MTEVTPEARARSRELRKQAHARNPNRLCPLGHKHGATSTCYNGHGCRCVECCAARSRKKREEYYGIRRITRRDVKVSSLGAQRRLQALAFMGWSCMVLAERMDTHYRPLNRLRGGGRDNVMLSTHLLIDRVHRELAARQAPGRSGVLTRAHAQKRGWVSAAAWDDIDDPVEQPKGVDRSRVGGVDRELVEWLAAEGFSDSVIAERLGCSDRTVLRVRQKLGIESKWAA